MKNICFTFMNAMIATYVSVKNYLQITSLTTYMSILDSIAYFFIIFLVSSLSSADNKSSIASLMFVSSFFTDSNIYASYDYDHGRHKIYYTFYILSWRPGCSGGDPSSPNIIK